MQCKYAELIHKANSLLVYRGQYLLAWNSTRCVITFQLDTLIAHVELEKIWFIWFHSRNKSRLFRAEMELAADFKSDSESPFENVGCLKKGWKTKTISDFHRDKMLLIILPYNPMLLFNVHRLSCQATEIFEDLRYISRIKSIWSLDCTSNHIFHTPNCIVLRFCQLHQQKSSWEFHYLYIQKYSFNIQLGPISWYAMRK